MRILNLKVLLFMNNEVQPPFLFLACQIYGCLGAIFGTCSIMTMVVIGYDRYNVIVKGFSGVKITAGKVQHLAHILNIDCFRWDFLNF